jgi:FAD/FMN-containing dehydrogenase/Fe-S oxidoreductase
VTLELTASNPKEDATSIAARVACDPTAGDPRVRDRITRDLRRLLRGDVEFDAINRFLYATDAGLNQVLPLGVVSPRDTEDVVRLVEFAAEHGLPLVPRGMGSGLAGGAVGSGIQVDFSRYMNRVLEIAPDGSWARVQPGVVMADLNRQAAFQGSFFAPDPSSENYCSLGGMIGTNSSGARTVAYGGTKDHVLALETVLADGSVFAARPVADGAALAAFLESDALAGRAFAQILPELRTNAAAIAAAMPDVVKNCSGYRLETVFAGEAAFGDEATFGDEAASGTPPRDGAVPAGSTRLVHLQKLFVGAEGTLGLVTEATLNLVPLPRRRGIAMAYFPSVFSSGEAVPGILALRPTAVEIMDSRFLALVRRHDSRVDAMLPERTDTALLIEFEGVDDTEVEEKFAALGRHLAGTDALKVVRAESADETARLWTVRKSAVALALRMPGPRRALPFIEDVTVHPSAVPGYVDFLQRLFDREKVDAVMYGHVGDGNIHTRPLLDPKDPEDLRTMQRLYDEVSAYVRDVRGTMTGEHGDGLLRTPYLRETYGDTIYSLFVLVKDAFDPRGILNPGKKVGPQEESGSLLRDLRYGFGYHTFPQQPVLHFPGAEYEREIEKCHGCGQCKSTVVTTMCPTYKATRREQAAPRAKANLLRGIITGALDPVSTYGEAAMKAVTDWCIVCGMCALECPSNVNIPKLMLEAKTKYRAAHHGTATDLLLGHPETTSAIGSRLAPLANPLLSQPILRRVTEPLTGVDRRRHLPRFARRPVVRVPVTAGKTAAPGGRSPLAAYFADLFATFNDPQIAQTVVRLLQAHGLEVVVPKQRSSGIPEMLYGYADAAGRAAAFNVESFLPWVERGAAVLTAEPTASFAFKVHYPDYLGSRECSAVAEATHDLGEFLQRYRADRPQAAPIAQELAGPWSGIHRIAYHQPCHLKAQQIGNPGLELVQEIPGVEVVELAAGCCGMAGTFGMKKGTYDLSVRTGAPLFERIAALGPDLVASECSTCRLQIAEATSVPTAHPVMLLAGAYGI